MAAGAALIVTIVVILSSRSNGGREKIPVTSSGSGSHSNTLRKAAERGTPEAVMALVDQLLAEARGRRDLLEIADRLNELVSRYPDYPYALRLEANLLRQAAKPERAVKAYRAYLVVSGDDMNTRMALSEVLVGLERFDEAIAELEKVIAAYPDFADAHRSLARVY